MIQKLLTLSNLMVDTASSSCSVFMYYYNSIVRQHHPSRTCIRLTKLMIIEIYSAITCRCSNFDKMLFMV